MIRFTFLLILTISLSGCASKPSSVSTIADTAHQQVASVHESLPAGCKTEAIKQQLRAIDSTIQAMEMTCMSEVEKVGQEKIRWKYAFFALALIVLAHIARKVIK